MQPNSWRADGRRANRDSNLPERYHVINRGNYRHGLFATGGAAAALAEESPREREKKCGHLAKGWVVGARDIRALLIQRMRDA